MSFIEDLMTPKNEKPCVLDVAPGMNITHTYLITVRQIEILTSEIQRLRDMEKEAIATVQNLMTTLHHATTEVERGQQIITEIVARNPRILDGLPAHLFPGLGDGK